MKRILAAAIMLGMVGTAAVADDIVVDTPYWSALSPEEQAEIADVLRATGLLGDGDELVSNPEESAADIAAIEELNLRRILPTIKGFPGVSNICRAACDAAAAVAATACSGSAIAVAACLVAVEAGRRECRRRC